MNNRINLRREGFKRITAMVAYTAVVDGEGKPYPVLNLKLTDNEKL